MTGCAGGGVLHEPVSGTWGGRRRPGRKLWRAVGWDLRLQLRYHIVTVAAAVALLYVAIFRGAPVEIPDEALVLLIFSDPSVLGFLFIGVLVLFERGANTLEAVVVTPLSSAQYLWSKAISLTLIALPCGLAMGFAGHGARFSHLTLAAAVTLSSLLFIFLGFVGVARVRTVNEYLLIVPAFLGPLNLPFLGLVGILESPLFYLIPTQASLVLFQAAFEPRPVWELVYAVSFLSASVFGAFLWAHHAFEKHLRAAGGSR